MELRRKRLKFQRYRNFEHFLEISLPNERHVSQLLFEISNRTKTKVRQNSVPLISGNTVVIKHQQ